MSHPFDALNGESFIRLTTTRKNGNAVPTPVWFAHSSDGSTLYVHTGGESGKVKRIRHTPEVQIAPCDARGNPHGDDIPAQARIMSSDEDDEAQRLLRQKYGIQWTLFMLPSRVNGNYKNSVRLELTLRET